MVREYKAKAVEELAEALSRSKIAIVTDFRGAPTNAVTQLRRQLREAGVEYRVVKNTLTTFAAEKAHKESIKPLLQGPTAIAFGYDDETTPARILAEYMKSSGVALRIKGAMLGDRVLEPGEVSRLPLLPSREALVAELMGRIKAPISGLVATLGAPLRGLVLVLQARAKQMEGAQMAS
ncbi:MAG: 50S ribosomal protein L10 [Chloroflexota bacterium]